MRSSKLTLIATTLALALVLASAPLHAAGLRGNTGATDKVTSTCVPGSSDYDPDQCHRDISRLRVPRFPGAVGGFKAPEPQRFARPNNACFSENHSGGWATEGTKYGLATCICSADAGCDWQVEP